MYRDENMAYIQHQSVKPLVGPFGSSNPSVVSHQLLHGPTNVMHSTSRVFSQLFGTCVALTVALNLKKQSHATGKDSCCCRHAETAAERRTQVHVVRLGGSLHCEDEIENDSGETVSKKSRAVDELRRVHGSWLVSGRSAVAR